MPPPEFGSFLLTVPPTLPRHQCIKTLSCTGSASLSSNAKISIGVKDGFGVCLLFLGSDEEWMSVRPRFDLPDIPLACLFDPPHRHAEKCCKVLLLIPAETEKCPSETGRLVLW